MHIVLAAVIFCGYLALALAVLMLVVVNKAWVATLIWDMLITPMVGVDSPPVIVLFGVFLILHVGSLKSVYRSKKKDSEQWFSMLTSIFSPYLALIIAWLASLTI